MDITRRVSGKSLIRVILAVVLLLAVGAGAALFVKSARGGKSAGARERHVETSFWQLDEFVINLADTSESRYLKANVVIEVEGDPKGSGEGGPSPNEVRAKDAIISTITKKSYLELQSAIGRAELKSELKKSLNTVLEDMKVVDIYFTSFAMQ